MATRPTSRIDRPDEDGGVARSEPPGGFHPVGEWSLDSVKLLSPMRAGVVDKLAEHGYTSDELVGIPGRLALIASELAANAIEHGIPPTVVRLLRNEGTWLIDVADHDLRKGPVYAGIRIEGKGGLGLHLARELSLDVGWYTTARTKHVWATFPIGD